MFPWIGGKYYLRNHILNNFPKDYKNIRYVEVFGGSAKILFFKEKSRLEVYNDKDENIYNFYYQVRNNYKELRRRFSLYHPACQKNVRRV